MRKVQIGGNYKNFHHALVALWGNYKVLGQNIHPWSWFGMVWVWYGLSFVWIGFSMGCVGFGWVLNKVGLV